MSSIKTNIIIKEITKIFLIFVTTNYTNTALCSRRISIWMHSKSRSPIIIR